PVSGSAATAFLEDERTAAGNVESVAALLLPGGECRFRCLMCDLWKGTHPEPTSRGVLPDVIARALDALPPVRRVKLYNAASWFDARNVPEEDDAEVA